MKTHISLIIILFIPLLQFTLCDVILPTPTPTNNSPNVPPIVTTNEQNNNTPTHAPDADKAHHDDHDHDKKNPEITVETIYKTVTEQTTPSILSVSNSGSGAPLQQQPRNDTANNNNSPNPSGGNDRLTRDINQNQQALKRMILILSLVGGLGVIAIVATIVIFTKIRAKNRRHREEATEAVATATDSASTTSSSSDDSYSHRHSHHYENEQEEIVPSAPPALAMIESPQRRYVISMISQTTAAPSAPTAKELDAIVDDNDEVGSCSRYAAPQPEGPPPAYTPSAPPHYALPMDAVVLENVIPPRRHSYGS
ncbi:hypothetical protein RMATCC62417_16850 [Rhizopus microsporus]|nr:hypothetical protein RMATCC62417_16850 [Rhizopus microsporus]